MKVLNLWRSMRVLGMDRTVVRVLAENQELAEIKRYARSCFRRLVFESHPDQGGSDDEAATKIGLAKHAKDVICGQPSTKLFLAHENDEIQRVMELLEGLF